MNAYERWVSAVLGLIDAGQDPCTLEAWGRQVGASASTLKSRCAAAGQGAKSSLDFARLLRLVVRLNRAGEGWDPAELCSCDPRTVCALLNRGGLQGIPVGSPPPSVCSFLDRQHLLSAGPAAGYLARALVNRGTPIEHQSSHGMPAAGPFPSGNDATSTAPSTTRRS